jgi:hypothetical protein
MIATTPLQRAMHLPFTTTTIDLHTGTERVLQRKYTVKMSTLRRSSEQHEGCIFMASPGSPSESFFDYVRALNTLRHIDDTCNAL